MRVETQAIELTLKVRGSPSVKGQLIEFVRKRAKKHRDRPRKQITCRGESYVQNYVRSL